MGVIERIHALPRSRRENWFGGCGWPVALLSGIGACLAVSVWVNFAVGLGAGLGVMVLLLLAASYVLDVW